MSPDPSQAAAALGGLFPCPTDYYCKIQVEMNPNFPQNHIYSMQAMEVAAVAVCALIAVLALLYVINIRISRISR